ncbi:uncharacterized protein LOC133728119 isoform X3 [Rosa rugosa]|uniref:uncharacterized protein LOC133728119 isoform X3 n=1 Tax=Rosa rugosa TaxID=74645 RepID=UPI002B40E449|nr:uncharacterized protein LOC133728119 isoform X3 [Rosa rugosa]XP_062011509.1 uncharacterized protein LOC133728119 isoform X3 [Rosa rugosa]
MALMICDMVAEHLWRRIQRIHMQKACEVMKFEYQKKVASLSKLKKCSTNSEALEKSRAAVSHLHIRYIVDMQSMDPTVSKINSFRSACCRVNECEIPLLHDFNGSAKENGASIEKERRLLYVAMTRARTELFIHSNW